MERKIALQLLTVVMLCALMPFLLTPYNVKPMDLSDKAPVWEDFDPTGPYADTVIFKVIAGQDVQVAAVRTGEIDILTDFIDDAAIIAELEADPYVTVEQTLRRGFGHVTFNCLHYPFGFPEFRRAINYAIDKYEFSDIMWAGIGYPLDSPVPSNTPPWHNPDVEGTFYESDVPAAIAALESAGFVDLNGDGLREAPNGESFTFRLAYHHVGTNWQAAWQSQAATFEEIGIDFEPFAVDFNTYLDQMYQIPRAYEAVSYCYSTGPDPLFLAEFRTELIPEPYGNVWNWSNETFDDAMDNMLSATTFEDALEYAHEAQEIFVWNSPLVVTYTNLNVNAIRNDRWTGWINAPGWSIGVSNSWTPQLVKLQEGAEGRDATTGCGGTFNSMIPVAMDTQNPMMSTSSYGIYVLDQVYNSLVGDLSPIDLENTPYGNGLAAGWTKTIVSTPTPHWEFTFDLHTNATWHDGIAVTADDVVFSYNYIYDNELPNYITNFEYFDSIVKVDDDTVKIVATSDSYWAWEYLRGWHIIPEHIWEGIVNPITYTNPVPIGSGAYMWTERVEGEYIRLDFNPGFHRGVVGHEPVEGATVSYVGLYLAVGVLVIVIVLLGSVWYLRKK
ncbi:MAG: ABC transporter substrate-binding protein [Promethearchaeota archaeon]